jgi:hypothetical protein
MMASAQLDDGSKHAPPAYRAQALRGRYRASESLRHAVNFAGGVAIGGIIALLFWLMVG